MAQLRIGVWTCAYCGQPIEGLMCIACGNAGAVQVEYVRTDPLREILANTPEGSPDAEGLRAAILEVLDR
jgi:hypothetical protein